MLGILPPVGMARPGEHQNVGQPGPGPVDVLAGLDGSPQAAAALAAALDLLGPCLGAAHPGRPSVAAQVKTAALRAELEHQGELATAQLASDGRAGRSWAPELLLAAGNPAEVLGQLAAEGGYDLLIVGSRGALAGCR
jgi:nucleotide-binding universal stress UspA family protein